MSGPNKLLESVDAPPEDITIEAARELNEVFNSNSPRQRVLWIFVAATKQYEKLNEDVFELADYQLAAEMVMVDE